MSSAMHFVRVAAAADIKPGSRRVAFAEGKLVVLFNVDGAIYALDDACPHRGSSLAAGKFDGMTITCSAHGLRFDVRTGRMSGIDGLCAKRYAVQCIDGEVHVGIDSLTEDNKGIQ
jgi:3-phenylpropionate/trans-cinnamate dioxygenase ferredoxin subunit